MKKTALFKKIILAATAALFMLLPASAEYNKYGIPDSAEIRKVVKDAWFVPPLSEIRNKTVEMRLNNVGQKFQIRLEEGVDEFEVIVSPQTFLKVESIIGQKSSVNEMEVFAEGSPGSWVLYRNKETGKATKIRWYFNADAEVYIQFRPDETKTYADLIIFNSYAARSVPVGIPFEQLYTCSYAEIRNMTAKSLPWQKVNVIPKQYHASLQMAAVIKENIPRIDYAEDACYNESGELYGISTGQPLKIVSEDDASSYDEVVGNSVLPFAESDDVASDMTVDAPKRLSLSGAGFIKWIIDGLIEPRTGSGTKIVEMLDQTVTYNDLGKNGVRAQKYNLSFTLDWVRNLAAADLSSRSSRTYTYKNSGIDVTIEPFAGEIVNGKLESTVGYIKDTGYATRKLKSLLYVLAISEPAYCYLGAIRQPSTIIHDDMAFNECAIFFPYFDDNGKFGCYVFENGREMTLESFCGKYTNAFVHLERVKAQDAFFPR